MHNRRLVTPSRCSRAAGVYERRHKTTVTPLPRPCGGSASSAQHKRQSRPTHATQTPQHVADAYPAHAVALPGLALASLERGSDLPLHSLGRLLHRHAQLLDAVHALGQRVHLELEPVEQGCDALPRR